MSVHLELMLFSCCSHLGSAVLLHYILTDLALFLQEQWHVIICVSGSKEHTQCVPFSLYPSLRYEYFFSNRLLLPVEDSEGVYWPQLCICVQVCAALLRCVNIMCCMDVPCCFRASHRLTIYLCTAHSPASDTAHLVPVLTSAAFPNNDGF